MNCFRCLIAVFAVVVLEVAASHAAPVPATKAQAPVVLPGSGVADPDGKVAYVPNTGGGIDALDLATGKRLWQTNAAPRPLLATADRLFAEVPVKGKGHQVRIIVLDTTQEGKKVLESQPVSFPDWVSVGVSHGRSFASSARTDGEGGLLLTWQARAWYAGGAAPPPEVERAARKSASGVARIDLKSGRVEALESNKIPKGTPQTVAAPPPSAKIGDRTLSIEDTPIPGRPFQQKRTLRAAENGKVLWQHEIAAPVFLPPPP